MTTTIVYTKTDEAPALATYSLLPIVQAFTSTAGVAVETRDISLAGRILATFADALIDEQRQPDGLAYLGELVRKPAANIIKLPNISASIPQLKAAIKELQTKGYDLPDYPEEPSTDAERETQARYAGCLGSAVNPVLREGNSDRRVMNVVKQSARKNPKPLGAWSSDSKTHVAHMESGDFFGSEQSVTIDANDTLRIEFIGTDGKTKVLKQDFPVLAGEIVDGCCLNVAALRSFFASQIDDAKSKGVLLSLHLKATMMKVSDPIIFGHCVREFYKDVFTKHAGTFEELGVDANHGIGDVYAKIQSLPDEERSVIEADLKAVNDSRPPLAMVDSDRGITNLHVPSDIIIDASMPVVVRDSGRMWGPDGKLHDVKAVIPGRSYAGVYQEVFRFCKEHGAFDRSTMGNVANVGLMARKAEEYGSHDKTFEMDAAGTVRVVKSDGTVLMQHALEAGDIWRGCQTKDEAVRDWVRLAVERARLTGATTIFWLNEQRPHDAELLDKVTRYLKDHDTEGLDISFQAPVEAVRTSMQLIKDGKDTISVTGNVLRDYLTDLFPILELGTSAKMLSIVPLLAGGGLYETGAGGSAPKHVQQFQREGHLRWDSLGEFMALTVSLEDLAAKDANPKAGVLARALRDAIGAYLEHDKAPSRKVNELDNRGSHFYLALYWAQALADQTDDPELQAAFRSLAKRLAESESIIVDELNAAQGSPQDIGGYYRPDEARATAAMRPSPTFNDLLEAHIEASAGALPG